MALIDEVKKYQFVGMPFEAFGFPQPVYSHLVASNDGVNWKDLNKYSFGWRDTDIAYINGEFWICTGTYVTHTTDFENFTQINCPNMGLKNLWASEFFQDKDDNWWFIYCGSETDVDYSQFQLYASRIYPEKYQIDSNRQNISLNVSGGYIDPNINYINGTYYLWCSKTNTPTQELHLFNSTNVLGPYDEVPTNIMTLTNKTGFAWNEAPEMLQINGKYYLYSDPWNRGQDEHSRDVYRCESPDLINWSNMERCNADCTMRHFTPLYVGNLGLNDPLIPNLPSSDSGISGNTSDHSTPPPEPPKELTITMWGGNAGTLEITNQENFQVVNTLINQINQLSKSDSRFIPVTVNFDLDTLSKSDRGARNQFLDNAQILSSIMKNLFIDYRYFSNDIDDLQKAYQEPTIPTGLILDKTMINDYWSAVASNISLAIKAVISEGGK